MPGKWMRYVALLLALAWAGWWVFFETAEAVSSHEFGQAMIFAILMFGAVAVAWRWPVVGGAILVWLSLGAIALFTPMWIRRFGFWTIVLLFSIMPLPPFVAGVLLFKSGRPHAPVPH